VNTTPGNIAYRIVVIAYVVSYGLLHFVHTILPIDAIRTEKSTQKSEEKWIERQGIEQGVDEMCF